MEHKYKKILELYCGKEISKSVDNNEDVYFGLFGENKDLIINKWVINFTEPVKPEEQMKTLIDIFNIVYDFTDKENMGSIVDFGFNTTLVYFQEIEKSIQSVKKIISSILKLNLSKIEFTNALHKGEVIIGNWGSSNRFKHMILGSNIKYCEALSKIGIDRKIKCIVSEDFKNEYNNEVCFNELNDVSLGMVGFKYGKIFELIF